METHKKYSKIILTKVFHHAIVNEIDISNLQKEPFVSHRRLRVFATYGSESWEFHEYLSIPKKCMQ